MSGKWHLGHKSPFLPTDHGFETYFGIPYSNDMDRVPETRGISQITLAEKENFEAYNVPLMIDDQIIERPADQRTITMRYTEEAVERIREFRDEPFFIYRANSLPHIPLFRSEEFKDASLAGFYGDVIEEIDRTVHDTPLLFSLTVDPSERYNVAEEHPEVIAGIKKITEEHLSTIVPVENQLER